MRNLRHLSKYDTVTQTTMEPFIGYHDLEKSLIEDPASVVNELRGRVATDLSTNGEAWILIGRALLELGFSEQGNESISYGQGLKSSEVSPDADTQELVSSDNVGDVQIDDVGTEYAPTSGIRSQTNPSEQSGNSVDFAIDGLEVETDLIGETTLLRTDNEVEEVEEPTSADLVQETQDMETQDKNGEYSEDTEAIVLMASGRYEEAMESWTKLIRENETSGRWNGLAECLEALGYSGRANKARIRGSSTRDARRKAANVDLEALAESVERRTPDQPTRAETVNESIEWYNKGISLLVDGKPLEALGCFEKTLYTKADDTVELRLSAKIGIADSYSALDRHEEAIRGYVQVHETNPDALGYAAVFNMGKSYTHLGRYDDAIACLKRSSEMNPEKSHKNTVKTMLKQVKALRKASRK